MSIIVREVKPKSFNLNCSNIINECEDFSKTNKYKKIYVMSNTLYDRYKQDGLIINKDNKEYYRCYVGDEWLIYKT